MFPTQRRIKTRMKFSCTMSRPIHNKQDKGKQEEFKKT
ncbi:hypothetical protein GO684_03460 [Wolbachia endosymbiont of Litomosoides brasiliensis]|nr:winged helix-turn-helix domain-containing protein [Wolbachia endosymbiont of Litomosoides brasiliensis]NUY39706.1 hypothetical protein [Wolbachia endosymbiont of Litomosoides brasiliensis]